MFELYIHYGMKIVGKLFLVTGLLFLLGLWKVLAGVTGAEERTFLMIFVIGSATFAGMGGLLLLVSRFMEKPEISEKTPEILALARLWRVISFAALGIVLFSAVPVLAVFCLTVDARDWLQWQDVTETGTFLSREDTNILADETPLFRCRFQVITPQGEKVEWESYSTETYTEADAVPLQRSGTLYRVRGTQFGIMDSTSSALLLCMLLGYLTPLILCIQGIRKLGRFVKEAG